MTKYDGKIKRNKRKVRRKHHTNWKLLIIWFISVLISFIPVFLDILVYTGNNATLTTSYWISACLHGDILWIIATILVLSIMDYITDVTNKNNELLIVGIVLWGLITAIWVVFKYNFPDTYSGKLPILLTVFILLLSIPLCTFLQFKTVEVRK